jgi:hypothetical protein
MHLSSASTSRSPAGLRLPELDVDEGFRSGFSPSGWYFEIGPLPDGEKALRYNPRGPVLGRGQVARHRVLVPGSQVRILPPQPKTVWYATAG